jgi:hypothetical protein
LPPSAVVDWGLLRLALSSSLLLLLLLPIGTSLATLS